MCYQQTSSPYEPKLAVTDTVYPQEIHRPFPWGTSVGVVPLEAEFSPPAEVTVPRRTGTALWLLEIPLDFLSKPCCTVVYVSLEGIFLSTRFKVCEDFLPYPHTILSRADFITNDASVIRLQILGRLSLKKNKTTKQKAQKMKEN